MYHSHANEVRDAASGLLGPMIITRRGMARPDGSPTDVDPDIKTYATEPEKVNLVPGRVDVDGNACGGHGAGQPRHVVPSLPRRQPPADGDAGDVYGYAVRRSRGASTP